MATGDNYLWLIFIGCCMLFAAKNTWILSLALPPLLYTTIKKTSAFLLSSLMQFRRVHIGSSVGVVQQAIDTVAPLLNSVKEKASRAYDIMVPHTMRDFVRFVFTSDQKVRFSHTFSSQRALFQLIMSLERATDLLSSIVVIVAVAIGIVLTGVFVAFQVRPRRANPGHNWDHRRYTPKRHI